MACVTASATGHRSGPNVLAAAWLDALELEKEKRLVPRAVSWVRLGACIVLFASLPFWAPRLLGRAPRVHPRAESLTAERDQSPDRLLPIGQSVSRFHCAEKEEPVPMDCSLPAQAPATWDE
jgi:hypothetical protein